MDSGSAIIFLGVMSSIVCAVLAWRSGASRARQRLLSRAGNLHRRLAAGRAEKEGEVVASVRRREKKSAAPFLARVANRFLPRQALLKERLAKTGRDIDFGAYALICIGLGLAMLLFAYSVLGLHFLLSLPIGVAAGAGAPHLAVGWMTAKRLHKFTVLFPDAIDLIVRGLKSGLPVVESIAAVGSEMADPVGHEFRLIADKVKFGAAIEDALGESAGRLDTQEFKFFAVSISVQRETGGNLAETLANLSDILRRRLQMRLKVRAMSSEARASTYILGSLPFLMFAIIYLINPGYETDLFTDPRGRTMVGGALLTMTAGIFVMYKMVKFDI